MNVLKSLYRKDQIIKTLIGFLMFHLPFLACSQSIRIDEEFSDWSPETLFAEDPAGDSGQSGIDITDLYIGNDEDHLFIRFSTGKTINLQQDNLLRIMIDLDNDPLTGEPMNGLGVELSYDPGMREGKYYSPNLEYQLYHDDVGLQSAPTVTANEFEISINRKFKVGNSIKEMGNTISICVKDLSFNGDQVPADPEKFHYSFKTGIPVSEKEFYLEKQAEDYLRIVSYNSLFDGLFELSSGNAQKRIIKALTPDIIAFQEIYDHTANEVATVIGEIIPLENNQSWYRSKVSPDIICISRYPIVFTDAINGNGIFIMEYKNTHIVLVNAHLPCCDNNEDRQAEIDFILYYLKELKAGNSLFKIQQNSPIIIVGDMNLVGDAQQQKSLITGDIVDENAFGEDLSPDWNGNPFTDAKPAIIRTPFHFSWSSSSSSYPPGRLDYQLYTSSVMEAVNSFNLHTANLTAEELNQYALQSADSGTASDHFPVVADYLIDNTVSVDIPKTPAEGGIRIFPNPADHQLNINYPCPSADIIKISLYNLQGRQLSHWNDIIGPDIILTLPPLENGIYMLRMQSRNNSTGYPIVIHHP